MFSVIVRRRSHVGAHQGGEKNWQDGTEYCSLENLYEGVKPFPSCCRAAACWHLRTGSPESGAVLVL